MLCAGGDHGGVCRHGQIEPVAAAGSSVRFGCLQGPLHSGWGVVPHPPPEKATRQPSQSENGAPLPGPSRGRGATSRRPMRHIDKQGGFGCLQGTPSGRGVVPHPPPREGNGTALPKPKSTLLPRPSHGQGITPRSPMQRQTGWGVRRLRWFCGSIVTRLFGEVSCRRGVVGYHIRLTRERSPVRSWTTTLLL